LGDAIQFLRYAPMLRSRCASVYVQGPPRLLPLLRCIPGIDRSFVFGDDRELDGCWDIECSDLPYLFRSGLNNIPPPTKIKIPADTLHRYRNHESLVGPGIRAGVVWEAGAWNRERSIPASLLAPLAEVPGIRLISLQRGKDGGTCGPQVPGILDGVEPKDGTILDTAAIATQIDLVISVDSMVGHLAASLGKPVWLLLPYAADWRWMLDRQDSPWYPTMRLFRQAAPGDWASVVRAVNAELRLIARVAVNQLVEIA
jgi:hypothetical protein